jgi:ankyrin repeat protein
MLRDSKQSPVTDNTLLHVMAASGTALAVQTLLDARASVLTRNAKGESPLVAASTRKDASGPPIVQLLVSTMSKLTDHDVV